MQPLRAVTATSEDPVVLRTANPLIASDHALRVALWNKGAEDLLGFTEHEVLGRPICELVGCGEGDAALRFRCRCRELLEEEGRQPPLSCERELVTKDGGRIWVGVTTIVTMSHAGLSVLVHLLRDLSRERELEELLRYVASGAAGLALHPAGPAPRAGDASGHALVTAREREVIRLLAQGASTDAIAASLSISNRTTRNHIQNILGKLGVHSRLQAVACASTRGLL